MHKHYLQKGLFEGKQSLGKVIGSALEQAKKILKDPPPPRKEAVKDLSPPKKEAAIPPGRAKGSLEAKWGRMVKQKEVAAFGVPFNAAGNQTVSFELVNRIKLASEDFKQAHPKDYQIMATKMQNSYRLFPEWRRIVKTKGRPAGQRFMKKHRIDIGRDGIWPAGGHYASGGGGHHDHPYMIDLAYPWTWLAQPEKHGLSKEGVKYFAGALNKQGLRYSKKDAKHLGNHIAIPRRTLQRAQVAIIKERPKLDIKLTSKKPTEVVEDVEGEVQTAESSLPRGARASRKEAPSAKPERLVVSQAPKAPKSESKESIGSLPKRTMKPYKVPKAQAKQRAAAVVQEKKPLRGPGKTRIARPRRYNAESRRYSTQSFREA
jgi:hypothetical protein